MPDTERVLLGGADAEELIHYRSISPRAILAVIAGLASPLALAHPLLWCVPLVAVVLAAAALRETAQPSVARAGRAAALCGLSLALLFGSAAITKRVADRQILVSHARHLGQRWLEAVQQGDLAWAVEWTQPYLYRQPPGVSLEEYYAQDPTALEILEAFSQHEVVRALQAAGAEARIEWLTADRLAQQYYSRRHTLQYRVRRPDGTDFQIELLIARDSDPESYTEPRWQIRSYELVGAPHS